MQHKKRIAKILMSSLFLALSCFASAETFRVHQMHIMPLTDTASEKNVTAGINDALGIQLPEDLTYINGIELTIKIPEIIASWRDTIAYALYNSISPIPQAEKIDYAGERICVGTFPGKLSYTIFIPLASDFSLADSPYHTILSAIPDRKNSFVFFRMQLAMKGVPESFETATFDITAKPVLRDLGELKLSVSQPPENAASPLPYSLYIDGAAVEQPENRLLLKTGEHHLSITSQHFRDEVRTFRIEQANSTSLSVLLRDIAPTVRIISPQNAVLYFDDEPFTTPDRDITVTPGDHIVRFVIGDYELRKTVSAVNGRSYTVNLSIDATISETE